RALPCALACGVASGEEKRDALLDGRGAEEHAEQRWGAGEVLEPHHRALHQMGVRVGGAGPAEQAPQTSRAPAPRPSSEWVPGGGERPQLSSRRRPPARPPRTPTSPAIMLVVPPASTARSGGDSKIGSPRMAGITACTVPSPPLIVTTSISCPARSFHAAATAAGVSTSCRRTSACASSTRRTEPRRRRLPPLRGLWRSATRSERPPTTAENLE